MRIITPCRCKYATVSTKTAITSAASRSESLLCAKILSRSSPPRNNSVTRYTLVASSYTYSYADSREREKCEINIHNLGEEFD